MLDYITLAYEDVVKRKVLIQKGYALPCVLGHRGSIDRPIFADLTEWGYHHLLLNAANYYGEQYCTSMIISLLINCSPGALRLIMTDLRGLKRNLNYERLPHLLIPLIHRPVDAERCLSWLAKEMEARFTLLAENKERSKSKKNFSLKLPQLVFIIDELQPLILVRGKESYRYINRLVSLGSKVGIHLILCSNRAIFMDDLYMKKIFPKVISQGWGEQTRRMLDIEETTYDLERKIIIKSYDKGEMDAFSMFILRDETVKKLFGLISRKYKKGNKKATLCEIPKYEKDEKKNKRILPIDDGLYAQAVDFVSREQKCSASRLQRKFGIGYTHAAAFLERLEKEGIISPYRRKEPREVLISPPQE